MGDTKPRNQQLPTRVTEYGYFIRKKYRKGNKRRQKTTIIEKNPEKVVLGKLGDIEVYAYPFSFPDKVFLGIYPMSTSIEEHEIGDLFRIYNRIRWYFNNEWQTDHNRTKGANTRRRSIERASSSHLERLKKHAENRDSLN